MRRAWFTSATTSYWSRVTTLAESLRRHHPQDDVILVAVDHHADPWDPALQSGLLSAILPARVPAGALDFQPARDLSVVELCTAMKGPALVYLLDLGYDEVGYLDPDMAVLSPMSGLLDTIAQGDLAIVPHQLTPDPEDWAVRETEVSSLKYGVFNFGSFLVRGSQEGRRFAEWWSARLEHHCVDKPCDGLFTDQKWGNLVPIFFPSAVICRHPGVNVANWNLRERRLSFDEDGNFIVRLRTQPEVSWPLQLYHFSKAGGIGNFATARHGGPNIAVAGLWRWYLSRISGGVPLPQ